MTANGGRNRKTAEQSRPDFVAWGGYDLGKPRVRLLISALRKKGVLKGKVNIPVWANIRDKSVAGPAALLQAAARLLIAYPRALLKLLRLPRSCSILLAYPAIPDIFTIWPIAKLRRQKIVIDAFIPLYDTIVVDRALVGKRSMVAKLLWGMEWLALSLADIILVDTDAHGDYFSDEFRIDRGRFETVLVGAEPEFAKAAEAQRRPPLQFGIPEGVPVVLFYGQLIPLHGISTILDAVELTADAPFHWLIIGSGQQEHLVGEFFSGKGVANATWLPWVDYSELPHLIRISTVALGVFGAGAKAGRVLPNKLFQVLAAGRPIITRSSPAVERLSARFPSTVITVPAGDGEVLATAVRSAINRREDLRALPPEVIRELSPELGVDTLLQRLSGATR